MDDATKIKIGNLYKMITELANQVYNDQKAIIELQKQVAQLTMYNATIGGPLK